ncbi:MAG: signal peptidase II [bacterium]
MKSPGRVFWPLASLLLLADCSSKRAIEEAFPVVGVQKPIVHDVVKFSLAYNQGAAFSTHFGPYQRWVLIAFALAVLCMLALSYGQITRTGRVGTAGLALVVGGAVGNMLDRLISNRGVVDFIDIGVGSTRFYVFNIADVGVSLGAMLLAFALWRSDRDARRGSASLM